jgi:hypothetical protein
MLSICCRWARLKIAKSRVRAESFRRIRMAQISLSFNGGFCPVNLPLFHGTLPYMLIAVVSMTFSFRMKETLVCAGCRCSLSDPHRPLDLLLKRRSRASYANRRSHLKASKQAPSTATMPIEKLNWAGGRAVDRCPYPHAERSSRTIRDAKRSPLYDARTSLHG